jgi:hypothetical protein
MNPVNRFELSIYLNTFETLTRLHLVYRNLFIFQYHSLRYPKTRLYGICKIANHERSLMLKNIAARKIDHNRPYNFTNYKVTNDQYHF